LMSFSIAGLITKDSRILRCLMRHKLDSFWVRNYSTVK